MKAPTFFKTLGLTICGCACPDNVKICFEIKNIWGSQSWMYVSQKYSRIAFENYWGQQSVFWGISSSIFNEHKNGKGPNDFSRHWVNKLWLCMSRQRSYIFLGNGGGRHWG